MKKFKSLWPIGFILIIWFLLFFPYFTKGKVPMPADIIAGVYYPWLDYKWGYSTGVPVKNPLLSDVPSILYPWRIASIRQLKQGIFPLWNPYYLFGMPLFANFQSSVLSYVNIFFAFFDEITAWSLGVITSPLLTMLFMYLFLKNKKLSSFSCVAGSIIFSLSGFSISWVEYNVIGHTCLFLPLFLLIIDKYFENIKNYYLTILSFLIALQIFTGYVPVVIYSYITIISYILFFYLIPEIKKKNVNLKQYFLLFISILFGLGIASIQLFPGFELISNSIRKVDPSVSFTNASYLPFANILTSIIPDYFGNPATQNYFGRAYYDNFNYSAGTTSIILLFYFIIDLKNFKRNKYWLFVLIFSLLLSIKSPIAFLLEKIFFLSGGVAARALFLTDFSLSIICAYSINYLFSNFKKDYKKILLACLMVLLMFSLGFLNKQLMVIVSNKQVALRNMILPFVCYFMSSFILLLTVKKKKFTNILNFILLLIISFQLLYSAKKYLPFSPRHLVFPTTPILEKLQEFKLKQIEPIRVELGDVIPQNLLMPYGIETVSGYDTLLPLNTGQFFSIARKNSIDEKIARVQWASFPDSNYYPLTNAKYVLAKKVVRDGVYGPEGKISDIYNDKRYKTIFTDQTVSIVEDTKVLPRAFFVTDLIYAKDNDDFIQSGKKNDFSKTAIINNSNIQIINSNDKNNSKIEWRKNSPGKIEMKLVTGSTSFLVLLNNYYKGWTASLDGRTTEIIKTNYTFQGVLISKGEHSLILTYNPFSYQIGKIISIIFVVLNMLLLIINRKKCRKDNV